jgi:hypothetical protein
MDRSIIDTILETIEWFGFSFLLLGVSRWFSCSPSSLLASCSYGAVEDRTGRLK